MNDALSVTGSFLIVMLFAGLFCLIGRMALCKIGREEENPCYIFAASYFIGMAVYLSVLRTLTMVIRSYRAVFWTLLILTGVIAVMAIYRRYFTWLRQNIRLIIGMICLWIACTLHAMLYRMVDVEQVNLTPYTGIGTIGSLRYAGIVRHEKSLLCPDSLAGSQRRLFVSASLRSLSQIFSDWHERFAYLRGLYGKRFPDVGADSCG